MKYGNEIKNANVLPTYRYGNSGKRSYHVITWLFFALLSVSAVLAVLVTPGASLMTALYGAVVITTVAILRSALCYAAENEREAREREEEKKDTSRS